MEPMEIGQLAALSGVTRRTIRYYVAIGLLPPGREDGVRRLFSQAHLNRLALIRKMKDDFLPLDEIKRRLAGKTDREIAADTGDHAAADRVLMARDVSPMMSPIRYMMSAASADYARPDPVCCDKRSDRDDHRPAPPSNRWEREELAPAVELFVREDAPPASRRLVARIRALVRDHITSGYREPEANRDA